MKRRVTVGLDEGVLDWVEAARGESSRSRFVQACLEAVREVIGTQSRALDSDEARAAQAIETFRVGEVPSMPDLEALARWLREREVAK